MAVADGPGVLVDGTEERLDVIGTHVEQTQTPGPPVGPGALDPSLDSSGLRTYLEQAPINAFSVSELVQGVRCSFSIGEETTHGAAFYTDRCCRCAIAVETLTTEYAGG